MSNLWKLVKYTQGSNADGKISHTSDKYTKFCLSILGKVLKICLPIMVKVRPLQTAENENEFTILLILDKDCNVTEPPAPTIEGVFIYHQSEQICYAKRFGGFAKERDWKRESTEILEICKDFPINREEVYSVTYDMPTKLFNRHNEVLVAEINQTNTNEATTSIP